MIEPSKYKGKPNILIGGDVCGIQNYIYQIVSKYAAKSLKGRSFYVQLLTDAIVRYMLEKLTDAELVYNSGGGFFLIAPKDNENKLSEIINDIESELWERHGISLYVAIDWVDLDVKDSEKGLSDKFKELFEKRESKKFNKFADIITDQTTDANKKRGYKAFFTPQSKDYNNGMTVLQVSITLMTQTKNYTNRLITKPKYIFANLQSVK